MKRTVNNIAIAGAGVAGLSLARLLSRDGYRVTVFEKESTVGGLARSFRYGDFVFDAGPHRFYTDDAEVLRFIEEVLGDDRLTIRRKSGVWMFGRYFDWPLAAAAVLKMPVPVLLSVAIDLIRRGGGDRNFEEYIVRNYGETLYRIFFKPYTEKFLGVACRDIARDWAVTGIERAVIDEKVRMDDLRSLFRSLLSREAPLRFIYPRSGGISVFAEQLARQVEQEGGRVAVDAEVTGVSSVGGRIRGVHAGGEEHPCDLLVWCGPIGGILRLLGAEKVPLAYRALILFNYRLEHEALSPYQWCYYGAANIPFNRVSTPALFNPRLAPHGKSGICAEVTCMQGDAVWQQPQSLDPAIRKALVATGVARHAGAISGLELERIADAYPIYTRDYHEKLRTALEATGKVPNLKLLGRTGSFWYNNMDHSIKAALQLYRDIAGWDSP